MKAKTRQRRRYRVQPFRLTTAILVLAALIWLLTWAHSRPYVAASWLASDPLAARNGAPELLISAQASLAGRVVAAHAYSGEPVAAVTVEAGRSFIVFLWPDGRELKVAVNVAGEPANALFIGDQYLVLWLPGGEGTGVGTLAAISLSAAGQGRTSVSPVWQNPIQGQVFGLVQLDNAVAVIAAGPEGLPSKCTIAAASTGKTLWQLALTDGVYTAWAGATPSGVLALSGAEYHGSTLRAFVRLYSAAGKLMSGLETPEGPAYLVRPSATGRYVLAVAPNRLVLADSEGRSIWTARFPPVRVEGAWVGADGQAIVVTSRNTLVLDQRGAVRARWRTPGTWWVAPAPGGDEVAVGLLDGVALLDLTGRVRGIIRGGGTGILGLAAGADKLCRVTDTMLYLYEMPGAQPR